MTYITNDAISPTIESVSQLIVFEKESNTQHEAIPTKAHSQSGNVQRGQH